MNYRFIMSKEQPWTGMVSKNPRFVFRNKSKIMGGGVGVLNFQVLSLKACCTLKKPIFLAKSDTLCPKCTKGWSGTSD